MLRIMENGSMARCASI